MSSQVSYISWSTITHSKKVQCIIHYQNGLKISQHALVELSPVKFSQHLVLVLDLWLTVQRDHWSEMDCTFGCSHIQSSQAAIQNICMSSS
jgi:hypothetical protein